MLPQATANYRKTSAVGLEFHPGKHANRINSTVTGSTGMMALNLCIVSEANGNTGPCKIVSVVIKGEWLQGERVGRPSRKPHEAIVAKRVTFG
jgi:hypothetical protein